MNFLLAIIKFKFASRAANLRAAQRTRKSTFPKINGTRYELQIASRISQPVVLLAPVIERGLRNPGLAAYLPDHALFFLTPTEINSAINLAPIRARAALLLNSRL